MKLEHQCKLKQINQDDTHSTRITGNSKFEHAIENMSLTCDTTSSKTLNTAALISSFEYEKYHF